MNTIAWVLRDAAEDVLQIGLGIQPVELGSSDQGIHGGGTLAAGVRSCEQVVFPTQSNHAVILPISGKKLKFITAGIHFMVDAYACSTASSVRTAASCMLRSNLAL